MAPVWGVGGGVAVSGRSHAFPAADRSGQPAPLSCYAATIRSESAGVLQRSEARGATSLFNCRRRHRVVFTAYSSRRHSNAITQHRRNNRLRTLRRVVVTGS